MNSLSVFKKQLIFILLLVLFISCKKKEKEQEVNNNYQNKEEPKKINGYFSATNQYYVLNDSLKPGNGYTYAIIYDSLEEKDVVSPDHGIDVGSVSVNNIIFKKPDFSNIFEYSDSSNSFISKPYNWMIDGSSNFPVMEFMDYSVFPSYFGYNDLPDTLNAMTSNTISINNYAHAQRIDVFFRCPNGFTRTIYSPANQIILNTSDIGQLSSSNNTYVDIRIIFSKNEYRIVNNKVFQLNNAIYVWKGNVFIDGV